MMTWKIKYANEHLPMFEQCLNLFWKDRSEHDIDDQLLDWILLRDPSTIEAWENLLTPVFPVAEKKQKIQVLLKEYKFAHLKTFCL